MKGRTGTSMHVEPISRSDRNRMMECLTRKAAKRKLKECQTIDADCNDCKHFLRGSGNSGVCPKKSQKVMASPNTFTGMACFEHRRG